MSAHRPLKSAMRQGASAYADGRRVEAAAHPSPHGASTRVTPGALPGHGRCRAPDGRGGPSAGVSLELRIGRAGAAGVTVNAAVRCGVVND